MLGISKSETLAEKSARLKNLIAQRKGTKPKVVPREEPIKAEEPEPVPTPKVEPKPEPLEVQPEVPKVVEQVEPKKTQEKLETKKRPRRITNPGGTPRKQVKPKKKQVTKRPTPTRVIKPRKWVQAKPAAEPVQRTYRPGNGELFELERQIIDIAKNAKGSPVAIRDIARELFGKNVISEAHTKGAGLQTTRTVRNAVRKPVNRGFLKRWTKEDDPEASPGYVCFVTDPPPPEKPKKKTKKRKAVKTRAVSKKRRVIVGSRKKPQGVVQVAKERAKQLVKDETRKTFKKEEASESSSQN